MENNQSNDRWMDMIKTLKEVNIIPKLNDRILLIDFLNLFFRCFSASPASNINGEHVGGISGSFYSILNAVQSLNPTRIIFVSDGENSAQRKRKLYPEYKQGRKMKVNLNRTYDFKDSDEEHQSLMTQMQRLIEYLDNMPVQIVMCEGVEADDVIAYIAQEVFTKDNEKIYIMSSDKDYLQLVNERIHIWSPTKKKLYFPDTLKDEYGISPQNFLLYRTLEGDVSDNLPGVHGVGRKSLIKCVPILCEDKKVTINELLKYVTEKDEERKGKLKIYKNILSSKEVILLNEQLMQLNDPNMSGNAKAKVTDILKGYIPSLNRVRIQEMYNEDGLSKAIPDIQGFLIKTFRQIESLAIDYNKKMRK